MRTQDLSHTPDVTFSEGGTSLLLFTAQQVAERLQVSRDAVRAATMSGYLPYRAMGTSVQSIRYTEQDIQVWLEQCARVGAREPIPAAPAVMVLQKVKPRGKPRVN